MTRHPDCESECVIADARGAQKRCANDCALLGDVPRDSEGRFVIKNVAADKSCSPNRLPGERIFQC